jgi:creatinine amidohydrolase/Fe(II)-dependent formamide hydrolase-like protein
LLIATALAAAASGVHAQSAFDTRNIVELELLTNTEVYDKVHNQGMTSVLVVTGGTEARGPHNILAGHTIMAHNRAVEIAKVLGHTLVAPVLPFAVDATGVAEETKTPGGVEVPADVFKAIQLAEIQSMVDNGFKDIFLMGDHGGGQAQMKEAAEEMDAKLSAQGIRVYYINDFYQKTHDDIAMYLYEHDLPVGGHGAMMETSEMLYWQTTDGAYVRPNYTTVPGDSTGQTNEEWKAAQDAIKAGKPRQRRPRDPNAPPRLGNGLTGDPHASTPELGKIFAEMGINNSVAEIREQMAAKRGSSRQ